MRVILAQPRGFCAGVVRAIDIVEKALDKYGEPVYVRHEIVHNKHVVDTLKNKGARFVEELDEVPEGAVTVFSAHGVPQSVVKTAQDRGLPVLDATCPLVSKVHNQGKRYVAHGRTLILIGHAGHPEVEGTMGQVGAPVTLVQHEADVATLDIPPDTPVAYITQTTLSIDDTKGIIVALKKRFSDIVGPETSDICYATQNRQTSVRELAKIADVILVVGAANSSNSNRLREIGIEEGVPSYLINDGSELKPEWVQRQGGGRPDRRRLRAGRTGAACDRGAGPDRRRGSGTDGRQEGTYRVPPSGRVEGLNHGFAAAPGRQDRRLCDQEAPLRRQISAGADAGAAVPLQPGLRRLRQDRLSRRDPEPAPVVCSNAWTRSTSAARPPSPSPAASPCSTATWPRSWKAIIARDKFVILCTNALLLAKKIDQYKPHPEFHLVHPSGWRQGDARQVGLPGRHL